MLKSVLSVFALTILMATCCLAFAQNSPPASRRSGPGAPRSPHVPVHQEMRSLDRHAKFDMILYEGRFGKSERAGDEIRRLLVDTATD